MGSGRESINAIDAAGDATYDNVPYEEGYSEKEYYMEN